MPAYSKAYTTYCASAFPLSAAALYIWKAASGSVLAPVGLAVIKFANVVRKVPLELYVNSGSELPPESSVNAYGTKVTKSPKSIRLVSIGGSASSTGDPIASALLSTEAASSLNEPGV